MKKKRVTYAVYNMIEWISVLRLGKAKMKIPFVGGSITPQGVIPATFTTENPIAQMAIERSAEFRRGKIRILKSKTLGGDVEIESNAEPKKEEKAPEETEPQTAFAADVEIEETEAVASTEASTEASIEPQAAFATDGEAEEAEAEASIEAETSAEVSTEAAEASAEVSASTEPEVAEAEEAAAESKVFACNDDAKDFLVESFGFVRSKLRNREDIIAAGRSKGVEITFE